MPIVPIIIPDNMFGKLTAGMGFILPLEKAKANPAIAAMIPIINNAKLTNVAIFTIHFSS